MAGCSGRWWVPALRPIGGRRGGWELYAEGGEPLPWADDEEALRAWAARQAGAFVLTLADDRPAAVICLLPRAGRALEDEGLRVLQLSRHDLAVALRGAQLREALDQERRELSDIVEGATDAIVQVDAAAGRPGERCGGALAGAYGAGAGRPPLCRRAPLRSGRRSPGRTMPAGRGDGHGCRDRISRNGRSWKRQRPHPRGRRILASASPPDGQPRATAILRDIRAARTLEELREGFVATVSHELRTPLALIKGYADTILHLQLTPVEQHAYVERIEQTTQRLAALVTQILDITHLDADPLVLERSPARFDALVARLRGDLAMSGADTRLVVDLPPDLPPIEVDTTRVGQILDNLVGNALKYAPDGSPVTISAREVDGWLAATVDDEGVGVPDADAPLIFEPFHRARNVRESRISGTGLGLYITRRLVEAHGGRLSLEPREDSKGTRARFTLPLAPGRKARAVAGTQVPGR